MTLNFCGSLGSGIKNELICDRVIVREAIVSEIFKVSKEITGTMVRVGDCYNRYALPVNNEE